MMDSQDYNTIFWLSELLKNYQDFPITKLFQLSESRYSDLPLPWLLIIERCAGQDLKPKGFQKYP